MFIKWKRKIGPRDNCEWCKLMIAVKFKTAKKPEKLMTTAKQKNNQQQMNSYVKLTEYCNLNGKEQNGRQNDKITREKTMEMYFVKR